MTLTLYYHPFSSYCQKALIALYETEAEFERVIVDLMNPESRAAFARVWPLAKFPVLVDGETSLTLPEATIIVEYLAQHRRGGSTLVPSDGEAALQARLWDRFFDNYIHTPMQKIVVDHFRPEGGGDPVGVEQAKALLSTAYPILDEKLAGGGWVAGADFTLADCAAAPALFYANILVPFAEHRHLAAYYQRLLSRPSFARAVDEARPYRSFFPLPWPESYA